MVVEPGEESRSIQRSQRVTSSTPPSGLSSSCISSLKPNLVDKGKKVKGKKLGSKRLSLTTETQPNCWDSNLSNETIIEKRYEEYRITL